MVTAGGSINKEGGLKRMETEDCAGNSAGTKVIHGNQTVNDKFKKRRSTSGSLAKHNVDSRMIEPG